jgi:hypothetical protein
MSNGRRDDSVHFIREFEEGRETGMEMEACTLKTVSESKEKEKGDGDSKSSESETGSLFSDFSSYLLFRFIRRGFCCILGRGNHFFKQNIRDRWFP